MLVSGSAAAAALLEGAGLPAGLLLGPMLVAVALAATGNGVALPAAASRGGQAVVGCLVASAFTGDLFRAVAAHPWLFAGTTAATLGVSVGIGWGLARLQVLPGTAAVWGAMPGAATSMVLMARDAGADWQLVAVTTYLRVMCVAALASVLAAAFAGHAGGAGGAAWFPPLDAGRLAATLAVAGAGAALGVRFGLPAGALNGPLLLGGALTAAGWLRLELPDWLLAPAYAVVGWRIGLGFTREIVRVAARALPRVLAAVGLLIAFCAALAAPLARLTGRDMVTAYLATSPGGMDSVAIIANAAPVDVPFVMAMQALRFAAVLMLGPALARRVAGRHS